MSKIAGLPGKQLPIKAVIAQILEQEKVDGLVCVVRIDGKWETTWGGDITLGSLSMAALKLLKDVQDVNEDHDSPRILRA